MKTFNDANFAKEVLQNSEPTVVDFWGTQCGQPCDDTLNMLTSLEPLYPMDTFGTLLTNDNPATTAQYQITVLPTVLIFNRGVVVTRFNGPPTQIQMIEALNALIPHSEEVASETAG